MNTPTLYMTVYLHYLSSINYIAHAQYLYKILPTASVTLHINELNINITEIWKAVNPMNGVIMLLNLWLQCYYFCYNPICTIVLHPQQNRACKSNPFPAQPFVVMYWTIMHKCLLYKLASSSCMRNWVMSGFYTGYFAIFYDQ